jgi:hypothetical protein
MSEGIKEWDCANGFHVLRLHYTAHPEKRVESWVKKAMASMPTDRWEREMEINFTRTEGTPVYPDFNVNLHDRPLEYNAYRPLLRSWDFGRNRPRVLIAQKDTQDRLCVLKEIVVNNIVLQPFIQKVLAVCREEFPTKLDHNGKPIELEWKDFADPAGYQRGDKDERCSIEVLNGFGIYPAAREHSRERAINLISYLLLKRTDGTPGFYVNGHKCPLLVEAMSGGYVRDKTGMPLEDNYYEDIMDCLRYIVLNNYSTMDTVQQDFRNEDSIWSEELYPIDKSTGFVKRRFQ